MAPNKQLPLCPLLSTSSSSASWESGLPLTSYGHYGKRFLTSYWHSGKRSPPEDHVWANTLYVDPRARARGGKRSSAPDPHGLPLDLRLFGKRADSQEIVLQPDGQEVVLQPDGQEVVLHPDGQEVVLQPDGQEVVLQPDGQEVVLQPDGLNPAVSSQSDYYQNYQGIRIRRSYEVTYHTCVSSRDSRKCVTLLKLMTKLKINFSLLGPLFSDNLS